MYHRIIQSGGKITREKVRNSRKQVKFKEGTKELVKTWVVHIYLTSLTLETIQLSLKCARMAIYMDFEC
jgi:hypothetical protein